MLCLSLRESCCIQGYCGSVAVFCGRRCQGKSVVSAFDDVEVDGLAEDLCNVILKIDGHPSLFHGVTGNQ